VKWFQYILPILFFISCVDEVPLENAIKEPEALVVHAFFNPDSAVDIHVSRVSNISEPYVWISDALLSLKRKNTPNFIFQYISDGQYSGNIKLAPNDSLWVKIQHRIGTDSLELKIPSRLQIKQVDTFTTLVGTVGKTKAYRIHFKDSAYNKNFYRIYGIKTYMKYVLNGSGVKIDSSILTEKMSIGGTEIPFTRNAYNTYSTKEIMFSDDIFNGVKVGFVVHELLNKPLSSDMKLLFTDIYLENISEGMYVYLNSRNAHLWQQNSITQLPTKVNGNLNKIYGVVGAFTSDRYRIIN
jgi:hypothetical protein